MAHRHDDESASINRRDAATVRADYAAWLAGQPLSSRTREAYLAAVSAFVAWLEQRDAGPGDALVAPRARDLAARDYKRHMKVDRGLSPASVNQALAGMDHLFRFLGLGAAIVRREELRLVGCSGSTLVRRVNSAPALLALLCRRGWLPTYV